MNPVALPETRRSFDKRSFGCGCAVGGAVMSLVGVAIFGALLAMATLESGNGKDDETAIVEVKGEGDVEVLRVLADAMQKHRMPGAGAAVIGPEGVVAMAVAGVRKAGTDVPVALADKWHHGSNTKAMTATLFGMLVERGELEWSTTLGEIFPEIQDMNDDFKAATVQQILCHRGGFPANVPSWWDYASEGTIMEQRGRVVGDVVLWKPEYKPGSKMVYSNVGYVVAGAILERKTGKAWEEMMREEVFVPLSMASAGFGPAGTPGELDQPWPHSSPAIPAKKNDVDNPPVMAPAGTVHCSLEDYGKFLRDHLVEGRKGKGLLTPETYAKLHADPFGDGQANGWVALERTWGKGRVYMHTGSNTFNYALVWMAPNVERAFVVCLNQGDSRTAHKFSDEIVSNLIRIHLPE